ncbi:MAG: phage tail protein [Bacteroidia bacterium]|nr:phage tail protein [Bacteroidia bacterium]
MPQSRGTIRNSYPIPVYNFKVSLFDTGIFGIPGLDTSGANVQTLSFTGVSGLAMEKEHVVYKHGLSFLTGFDVIAAQPKVVNVTFKRGVIAKKGELASWYKPSGNFLEILFGKKKRDVRVDLCDEKGHALVSWTLRAVVPVKLDGPSFDASSNEVAIESLEVVASSVSVEYH